MPKSEPVCSRPTPEELEKAIAQVHHCLQLRADGCLVQCHAFWDGKSKGTLHCAHAARDKGIPVTWHR